MRRPGRNTSFHIGRYLDQRDRDDIHRLLHQGQTVRAIARALSRSPSTVSREIRRRGGFYSDAPPVSAPPLDVVAARPAIPVLNRALDNWLRNSQKEDDRMEATARRIIDEAARTHRIALRTDTVTEDTAFDVLFARAVATHPEIPERIWLKALAAAFRGGGALRWITR